MKRLAVILLLFGLLAVVPTAHAQVDCTPPFDAQLTAVNVTGEWTAWAIGSSVVWCGQGIMVTTYESTYIDTLYFDAYWLPYNLYWGYSGDGYLFQMNVATGQGYLISPHGQPPGDPGEAHNSEIVPASDPLPAETPTPAPLIRRPPLKPLAIVRFEVGRVRE